MNPMDVVFQQWPAILAGIVGALLPREGSTKQRAGFALLAAFTTMFVVWLWPSNGPVPAADAASNEWPHLLNLLIGLPLVGAAAVLFIPRQMLSMLRGFTYLVLGIGFVASLWLLTVPMTAGWHFQYIKDWIPSLGIRYHVALDGISLWLVLLTTFVTPIAAYASFGSIKTRIKELCFALLLLQGAMIGAFVALDMFLFYVFWELMLIPMYVMIGVWGGTNRIKAALKFFLYTMAGSLLMLAAILYLAYTYGRVTGGNASFDFFELQRMQIPRHIQMWLFWGFAISF
ncbi:MAG TPA: proton-conducting transporter membrane subunit, partial [Polyangium sp.]|nr:proton-conducting transporter membrane subunit [Polyangium sp.]